jgi:hypothetical protein
VLSASALRIVLVLAPCLVLAGVLAACNTTQQTAARIRLDSARQNAEHRTLDVKPANPDVRVLGTKILRGPKESAVVVSLRNTGKKPVNDLPLEVGVREDDGSKVVLNEHPLSYFQGHAPSMAPGEETTWVFTSKNKAKNGIGPAKSAFAKVGVPPKHPIATVSEMPLPKIRVTGVKSSSTGKGKKRTTTVRAEVENDAGFPQYSLAIYAWAKRGDRYVAAGRTSLGGLDKGKKTTVKLTLIGDPGSAEIHLDAPPTIFK